METTQKTPSPQTTGGSGSAEQIGKTREDQKNQNFELDDEAKQQIANDINIPAKDIADLKDLGAGSGRDDYAGGSGDGMTNTSTNEATDRF